MYEKMKNPINLLVLLGLLLTPSPPLVRCQKTYAQFQLVQAWTPTYCKQPGINCVSHLVPNFTLHGLWPAKAGGNTLVFCRTSTVNQNIRNETTALSVRLTQAWPSIRVGKTNEEFWEDQWIKHGICCLSKMTKMNYLTSVIRERNKINLLSILGNANIVPQSGTAYTKLDFENAVTHFTGHGTNIYVSCKPLNSTHVKLFEIYICLDATATHYIPCPQSQNQRGCSGRIVFPPN